MSEVCEVYMEVCEVCEMTVMTAEVYEMHVVTSEVCPLRFWNFIPFSYLEKGLNN